MWEQRQRRAQEQSAPPPTEPASPMRSTAATADGASGPTLAGPALVGAGGAVTRIRRRPLRVPAMPVGADGGTADEEVTSRIRRSSGRPLDRPVRERMETGFGTDLSSVRIHTGREPDDLNRSLNANAFTVGSDVFFAAGRYAPGTVAGDHLLAHELTHTLQSGGGRAQRQLDAMLLRDLAAPAKPATVALLLDACRAPIGGGPSLMAELQTLNRLNKAGDAESTTFTAAASAANVGLSGSDVDLAYAGLSDFVDAANAESGRLNDVLAELRHTYLQLHDRMADEMKKPGLYTPQAYSKAMTLLRALRFAKDDLAFSDAAVKFKAFKEDVANEEYVSWQDGQKTTSIVKDEDKAKDSLPGRTTLGGVLSVANQGTTGGQRYTRDRSYGSWSWHVSISFKSDKSRKAKSAKPTHTPIIIDTIHVTFRGGGVGEPRLWWKPTSIGTFTADPTEESGSPTPGMTPVAKSAVAAVVGKINCTVA